ncbi:MAG: 4Fe-4S binding protein [Anaerolineae bacterium]|nr:4Fe-4S binding protein [Anaerolineae bacterium]
MGQNAILVDLGQCIGCQACIVACKTGRELAPGEAYIHIREDVRGRFPNLTGSFVHHRCFHCADAACVAVCPTGALSKVDGLTAVDLAKCSGCGYCVDACPYGIPEMVDGHVSKCTGCTDLTQEGQEPWCVQTCPSGALKLGPRESMLSLARERAALLAKRFTSAQVYGETQLGGLGALFVLPDEPLAFGLPEQPQVPTTITAWQRGVQPLTQGITGLSVLATALAFVFARREHHREKRALAAQAAQGEAGDDSGR